MEAWKTVKVRRGVTAFPTAGEDKVARAAEEATRTRHQWPHFSLHSCISHTDGQRLNATLPTCHVHAHAFIHKHHPTQIRLAAAQSHKEVCNTK